MSQRYIGGLIYNPPGGFSGYFDGSSYLTLATNTALSMGTGDFTVEMWVFSTDASLDTQNRRFFATDVNGTASIQLGHVTTTTGVAQYCDNGSLGVLITGTTNILNRWVHLAAVRSSGTVTLYVNGVSEGTPATDNGNKGSANFTIGRYPGASGYTKGWISNLRVVKGTAVYTSNFTPPNGPLQAITNTSLLTCAYSTFRDGSTNNFTITVNGNTAVSTQNPFPLTTLPNPALGNQGNGVYSMSQYQSLLSQNLWPAVDPYWRYVTLMLHGNGTNGAQNNTFLDSSTNNFTITRNGNTTQGTFAPYGSNWSNYFDGNGDFLSIADNAAFTLGSGDWTIEAWVFTGASATQKVVVGQIDSGGNVSSLSFQLDMSSTDYPRIIIASGTTTYIATSSSTLPKNQWVHLAGVRDGSTMRIYVNGVQTGTQSVTGVTINDSSSNVGIGRHGEYAGLDWNGYISNFRLVKGTCVYPSGTTFTPPTAPLTAITNTQLLTCQSNRFIDNSTNAFTITRNGDVSVQAFSPFNPTAAWSAATNGGSGYFDGSGDYLTVANSANYALGTSDFTIELWWYPTASFSNGLTLFSHGYVSYCPWLFYTNVSNGLLAYASSSGSSWDVLNAANFGTVTINAWNHIALCRSGSTFYLCLNGVVTSTATSSASLMSIASGLTIGATTSGIGVISSSYITNARIIKGTALYTGAYTLPTAPLTPVTNTQFLLSATNAGIYDATSKNDLETVGNAQISTTQSKFGGASMLFDGSGDRLVGVNTPNLNFGSGAWTVEFWIYATDQVIGPIVNQCSQASSAGWGIWAYNGGGGTNRRLTVFLNGASFSLVTGADAWPSNTWTHIAVVKSGTNLTVYSNGTSVASSSSAPATLTDTTAPPMVGATVSGVNWGSSYDFTGYIDDLRITKGVARYTSSFTPQRSQWQDQ